MDGSGRVLIVEDDLGSLYALRTLFLHHGWDVSLSRTVAGALTSLDPPPDWIILDLELADGDGEEVLCHVREAGIPSRVAVVSGMLDGSRLAGLELLKPDLVRGKPISFGELLEACERVFRSAGDGRASE